MGQEHCMLLSTMWTQKGELKAVLRLAFGLLKLRCPRNTETEYDCYLVFGYMSVFGCVLDSG